jgi:MerR family mercuric resistance operon transcriptional regulator
VGAENMTAPALTIGRLARAAGVHVETIRYYQRRSLLALPEKPLGGVRHYPQAAVERVHFIKRAQALGFTLEEIAALLQLDDASACTETRELAARKLAAIERKLADLTAMREALITLIAQCDQRQEPRQPCPIIQSLARP